MDMFLFTASLQMPPQLLGNSSIEAAAQYPFEKAGTPVLAKPANFLWRPYWLNISHFLIILLFINVLEY